MKNLEELNLNNKKVIIFDLDGTLIDSIGIWNMVDQKLINNYAGIIINLDYIQRDRDNFLNNNFSKDIYIAYSKYLIDKYRFNNVQPTELTEIRKSMANEILKNEVGFKPDVVKLILKLKEIGYILVLTTVTTKTQLEIYYRENKKMLAEINIKDIFDLITTEETVTNKKPEPDIYFKIMNDFAVNPPECLIFEDSYTGVLAAKRAGIEVINIYDKYSDKDREKINLITDYSITCYEEFIIKCITKFEKKNNIKLTNW